MSIIDISDKVNIEKLIKDSYKFADEHYEYCKNNGMLEECKKVLRLSPVAWIHISLIGKYEFTNNVILLDLHGVIAQSVCNLQI